MWLLQIPIYENNNIIKLSFLFNSNLYTEKLNIENNGKTIK